MIKAADWCSMEGKEFSCQKMIYGPDAAKCPIKKQVLNAGKEPLIEFSDETKVCIEILRGEKLRFSCLRRFSFISLLRLMMEQ